MAPTVLVKDLLWRCSAELGDTSPQFQRFSELEMVLAANDGQNAIATYIPTCGDRVDAFKLAPGARQVIESVNQADLIPASGAAPTQAVRGISLLGVTCNMGADGASRGAAIGLADRGLLDAFAPGWQSTSGAEVTEYVYDPSTPRLFWVVPGVHTGDRWVELRWQALPVDIDASASTVTADGVHASGQYEMGGSSSDVIGIGDQWVPDLMHYILGRMWLKDGKFREPAKAMAAYSMFAQSINAQVQAITGTSPKLKGADFMSKP